MTPLQEMVFIGEIVFQVKLARSAYEQLGDTTGKYESIELWSFIQTILISAANVSKILWPPSKKCKQRGKKLQRMFNVDESNILYDRNIRNHFAHYDERIEEWFEKHPTASYIDLAFTAKTQKPWADFPTFHHRAYDHLSRVVTFRGETLDLNKVMKSLEELRVKCGY